MTFDPTGNLPDGLLDRVELLAGTLSIKVAFFLVLRPPFLASRSCAKTGVKI